MFSAGYARRVLTLSPDQVNTNLKYSFVISILYISTLTFTKLSILCLYIRVLVYDYVRIAAKVLLAIVLVTHTYILVTMFTACIPLDAFWDYSRRPTAYCHGMDIYWSHAGLNIATDFLIFILPLTVLHRIRSPRPQKIALAIIFLLAFSVCSISLARVILVTQDVNGGLMDVTWEGVNTGIWNAFEVNIAIVCACLVTLKPVGAKIFPRLFTPNPSASVPGTKEIEEARGPRSPPGRWGSEDADLVATVDEERGERGGDTESEVVTEKGR
ncbi:hypothetical protein QBC39DRAFT_256421 [Podospora conica]|nr:hypothetical protein QBC39DRAFT_256421 [Schizothecium conicum]